MPSDDDFFARLDDTGEDQVRLNLARGLYREDRKPQIEEWLRRKAQSRSDESERRRKKYERIAAIAAIIAAVAATVSAIASIIGLF